MTALSATPTSDRRTLLIVGATAGLGRALASQLAAAGCDLVLTGRDALDLQSLASDLHLRHGVRVVEVVLDLASDPGTWNLPSACAPLSPLDAILLPAGTVLPDDTPGLTDVRTLALMRANFLGLAQAVQQTLPLLDRSRRPVIVGFGSIASVRGRARNVFYSAAKRALTAYFESLRHALWTEGVLVQFYQLGYLDTTLAAGNNVKLPKADPADLASTVLRNLHKDFGIRYFPFWWGPLCVLLRFLPWVLYRRLRF